jgi:hypothetical protein
MENKKIHLVENRDVGFFSGVNRIIGALVSLKKQRINLNNVSISWKNRLYQNDEDNLFTNYIAPSPSLNGDETILLAADLVGDVMGAFMDSSTSALCNSVLADLNYFQSQQYLERLSRSAVQQNSLGVLMRGTDHAQHGNVLENKYFFECIDKKLTTGNFSSIFVATDEIKNLQLLVTRYGKLVTYNEGVLRSTNGMPIHLCGYPNKSKLADDVLLDAISLTNCADLIVTSSNISHFAIYARYPRIFTYIDEHIEYK